MSPEDEQRAELLSLRGQVRETIEDFLRKAGWEPSDRAGWWRERNPDRSWGRTAPTLAAVALVDRDLDEAA